MFTELPRLKITKAALVALAKLVKAAKLQELHILNGQLMTTVPRTNMTPADYPRLVADLRNLVGCHFNLHVDARRLLDLISSIRKLPDNDFSVEVGTRYVLSYSKGRLYIPRLSCPATVQAPLTLAGMRQMAVFQITQRVQGYLKICRQGGRLSVDLLLQAGEAYQLGVVDPEMAGHGGYLATISLPGKPIPDVAAGPELVLRARVFYPHWLVGQWPGAVTSRVVRLPQEPQPYWLISSIAWGRNTALLCEPLTLIREQCRQRSEQELDACLAQLAA